MNMFDPSQRTPEMSIDVSLGEFHGTHDKAYKAKELVRAGPDKLSLSDLRKALAQMEAGERLSAAETGPDCMYAPDYSDEIKLAEAELERRSEES